MSGPGPYPPPGPPAAPTGPPAYPTYPSPTYPSAPPGYVQPGWGPPGGHPQAGYLQMAPAHKPGAIPLRPLGLGDIFDGAFKIIRFNPKATIGSALLVSVGALCIPGLIALAISSTATLGNTGSGLALGASAIMEWLGLLFVTGMVIHVASAAAVGRRLSLEEAWAATRGKRWALVGLTLLLTLIVLTIVGVATGLIVVFALTLPTAAAVLLGIFLGVSAAVGMIFFWGRVYYLSVPVLMLERTTVTGALRRSWALTRSQFWRIFGIALLTALITGIVGDIISVPFGIAGGIASATTAGNTAVLLSLVFNALGAVLSSVFVTPFSAAVTSLQYIDQRIRKEGYDVELMTRAGIPGQ